MRMWRKSSRRGEAVAAMGLAAFLVACGPTIRPDFNSPEPAARNSAIVNAAATKDRAAVPDLVRMLQSDDPATRLLAITALERITGERLGYDLGDSEAARAQAVSRWMEKLSEGEQHPAGLGNANE